MRSALLSEHLIDGRVHLAPVSLLFRQLPASGRRHGVELGAPPALQLAPRSDNPAALGQAMQSWKERSRPHDEYAFRHLFDTVGNAHAMQRLEFQRTQNQEVECALQKISRFRHARIISTSDIECQGVLRLW